MPKLTMRALSYRQTDPMNHRLLKSLTITLLLARSLICNYTDNFGTEDIVKGERKKGKVGKENIYRLITCICIITSSAATI